MQAVAILQLHSTTLRLCLYTTVVVTTFSNVLYNSELFSSLFEVPSPAILFHQNSLLMAEIVNRKIDGDFSFFKFKKIKEIKEIQKIIKHFTSEHYYKYSKRVLKRPSDHAVQTNDDASIIRITNQWLR